MADYLVTDTELTSIADAIRTKGGTSAALTFPAGFVSAVNDIPTGGGGSYTVTIELDQPVSASSFGYCKIYEWDGSYQAGQQIGEITSATGSATVTTSTAGITLRMSGDYVVPPTHVGGDVLSSEMIGLAGTSDGSIAVMNFVVASDGELAILKIDWSD